MQTQNKSWVAIYIEGHRKKAFGLVYSEIVVVTLEHGQCQDLAADEAQFYVQIVSSILEELPHAPRPPQAYFVATHHSPTDRVHQNLCAAHVQRGPPAARPCASHVPPAISPALPL